MSEFLGFLHWAGMRGEVVDIVCENGGIHDASMIFLNFGGGGGEDKILNNIKIKVK